MDLFDLGSVKPVTGPMDKFDDALSAYDKGPGSRQGQSHCQNRLDLVFLLLFCGIPCTVV